MPEPGATVTFTVAVANRSVEAGHPVRSADDVFGDLLDPANPAVSANTCPAQPAAIPVGGTFSCSFDAFVAGDAGGPDHLDTVTAAATDDEGNLATGRDDASVSFTDVLPSAAAAKTPSVGSVPEPGGIVSFAVEVAQHLGGAGHADLAGGRRVRGPAGPGEPGGVGQQLPGAAGRHPGRRGLRLLLRRLRGG